MPTIKLRSQLPKKQPWHAIVFIRFWYLPRSSWKHRIMTKQFSLIHLLVSFMKKQMLCFVLSVGSYPLTGQKICFSGPLDNAPTICLILCLAARLKPNEKLSTKQNVHHSICLVSELAFSICYWRNPGIWIQILRILIEPRHEKTCFCHMRTTKAQISLRIRAVWSAPLLFLA